MERDDRGRFVKGHKVLGKGIIKVIHYNQVNGVWNKGLREAYKQSKIGNIKRSNTMKKRWQEGRLLTSPERSKKIKEKRRFQVITQDAKKKIASTLEHKYKTGILTPFWKNKVMDSESRQKISKRLKGKIRSNEFKQKISKKIKTSSFRMGLFTGA